MQARENHIYNKLFTKEKIVAYLQNRLGREERSLFEAHLKEDPFLEDAVEGYKMIPAADVYAFVDAICKDLDLITSKNRTRFISLQTRPLAIAALFLIFIGISWFAVWFLNNSAAEQQIARADKIDDNETVSQPALPADTDNTMSNAQLNTTAEKSQLKNETTGNNNEYHKEELTEGKSLTEPIIAEDETQKNNNIEKTDVDVVRSAEANTAGDSKKQNEEEPAATVGYADIPASADDQARDEVTLSENVKVKKGKVSENADKDITLSGTATNSSSSYGFFNEGTVYQTADEMPHYNGGEAAMLDFISRNLNVQDSISTYPGQEVIVKFIVDKNGKIKNPEIVTGINADTDAEVLRIICMMPNWIAGKQNGANVNVYVTLPVKLTY